MGGSMALPALAVGTTVGGIRKLQPLAGIEAKCEPNARLAALDWRGGTAAVGHYYLLAATGHAALRSSLYAATVVAT